ncbi:MAG: hypothetical protein RSC66_02160, partial [Comamonas sp.]
GHHRHGGGAGLGEDGGGGVGVEVDFHAPIVEFRLGNTAAKFSDYRTILEFDSINILKNEIGFY